MAKSILQIKDGSCYLCRLLHDDYRQKTIQEHHVFFGTANRKKSERFGMKVYLCLDHHTCGREAVHSNSRIDTMLKQWAQQEFEKHYPKESFREIFGKNYI